MTVNRQVYLSAIIFHFMSEHPLQFTVTCDCGHISYHYYSTKGRQFKCKKCGKWLRNPQYHFTKVSSAEIKALIPEITRLFQAKTLPSEIADQLQLNLNTVYEILRRLKLKSVVSIPEIFCGICDGEYSRQLEVWQDLEWCWIFVCPECHVKTLIMKPTFHRSDFIIHSFEAPPTKDIQTDP
jgi:transposase-like protein